jgi:hypothetical protein
MLQLNGHARLRRARAMQNAPVMRTILVAVLMLCACGVLPTPCHDVDEGGAFCVPDSGVAPAGQTLKLQVIDQCIGGCGKATLDCTVTVDGGTISLDITGSVCDPAPGTECALLCALKPMECDVPALAPGDYTVTAPGQSAKTLHVEADAGVASCSPTFQ